MSLNFLMFTVLRGESVSLTAKLRYERPGLPLSDFYLSTSGEPARRTSPLTAIQVIRSGKPESHDMVVALEEVCHELQIL
jgi:hypothetical protein